MKRKIAFVVLVVICLGVGLIAFQHLTGETRELVSPTKSELGGIQWFATLEPALELAERTNRPILFTSAAPHCGGVSGVW